MKLSGKARISLIVLILIVGLSGLWEAGVSISPRFVYRSKDLMVFYLLARAVRARVDPYQPMPQLAEQLQVRTPSGFFYPHPSPHPPIFALLCLPLAWLEYEQAAALWLVGQYLCLFASLALFSRWWSGRANYKWSVLATLVAINFGPLREDLIWGQVSIYQFFLFLVALWKWRQGRQVAGGLALGVAIAIKFIGWPLLLLLLMRRKWRALTATVVTLVMMNLFAVAVVGWDVMVNYFFHVGPLVMSLYRADIYNWSVWGFGERLFGGTVAPTFAGVTAIPLVSAPHLAQVMSLLLAVGTLIAGLWMAHTTIRFEVAFGIVVAISLLISPLMWPHYLSIMMIPTFLAALDMRARGFPRKPLLVSAILALILFLPRGALFYAIKILTNSAISQDDRVWSYALTVLSGIPTLVTAVSIFWFYRLSKAVELLEPYEHTIQCQTALNQNCPQP